MRGPILVTGGAGFVGSHVVDALLAEGHEVRVLDVVRPEASDSRAEWVDGDLRDPDTVAAAVAGVEAVSHQAAAVGFATDFDEVPEYVAHNDYGTAVLLHALFDRGFRGRLVLASSVAVYGEGRYVCPEHGVVRPPPRTAADLDRGRFDPSCPHCGATLEPGSVPEDAPLDPRDVYAATKLAQEHLCTAFARETGATLTALRYHNVYGPGMPHDSPYAVPPRVLEDGGQLRDFVHVADVARANLLALGDTPPGTYNVASGRPRTMLEMARALGGPEPRVTGEWRSGEARHVFGATDAAAERLGFEAAR
jgi:dTDP-L-rhamnose 4-epimerase